MRIRGVLVKTTGGPHIVEQQQQQATSNYCRRKLSFFGSAWLYFGVLLNLVSGKEEEECSRNDSEMEGMND